MSRNTVKWCPSIAIPTSCSPPRSSRPSSPSSTTTRSRARTATKPRPSTTATCSRSTSTRTEELAEEAGRKYISGPANPFLEGNQGTVRSNLQNLPGLTSRTALLPTVTTFAAAARGRQEAQKAALAEQAAEQDKQDADAFGTYEEQVNKYSIITGTPKTVIPKIPPRP